VDEWTKAISKPQPLNSAYKCFLLVVQYIVAGLNEVVSFMEDWIIKSTTLFSLTRLVNNIGSERESDYLVVYNVYGL